ncbi:MAG: hypothetical protein KF861_14775 [Planctomycetaceae bacterium]|nr:hypothetical protein [Planctomycetaceae bacterium]
MSESRFSQCFSARQCVTWSILCGGFLLGVIGGGLLFIGPSRVPVDQTSASGISQTNDSSPSNTVTALPQSENVAQELAAERDKLQRELEAEKLRREVESLRRELVHLQSSPVSVESPREPSPRHGNPVATTSNSPPASRSDSPALRPATPEVAAGPTGEATLACWNRMNAIILQEAALRTAPADGVTAANAAGFLDARIQAAEFAVSALRELNMNAVDPRVIQLRDQLTQWYVDGGKVAQTGRELLTRGTVQERQGSSGKRYQAAERSHSESVNAVNAAGEQVRQEMSRKFGLTFPPLN